MKKLNFCAEILADSMNPQGSRITTCELTYCRAIHSEFMTHRMFSRNAASSRAIPVAKMIERVRENPFVPEHWGANQKGMQAYDIIEDPAEAEDIWMEARLDAIRSVEELLKLGLHKQIANRLLEPWMWITVICTGNETAYENFFSLRCHEAAEPHIQTIAYLLREQYDSSTPKSLGWGELHLPLTGFDGDWSLSDLELKKVSTARCARVSYLTHDGERDVEADLALHDRLRDHCHWSPFEHVATAANRGPESGGNLGPGWLQYRKEFPKELCRMAPR